MDLIGILSGVKMGVEPQAVLDIIAIDSRFYWLQSTPVGLGIGTLPPPTLFSFSFFRFSIKFLLLVIECRCVS